MSNIYDIAKQAGVAISTVSRVLNNSPKVSPKTRQKVLTAMDALNYTPNVFARGLGLNSMKTVGLLCADISDPYFSRAVALLEGQLRSQGYQSILCCAGFDLENRKECLQLLISKRVDAVVILGSSFQEANPLHMAYILEAAEEIPIVMINGQTRHHNVFSVVSDDFTASRRTAVRLAEKGRRNIKCLYAHKTENTKERIQGFKAGLQAANLPGAADCLLRGGNSVGETAGRLREKGRMEIDAVLACTDTLAIGFLKYAKSVNISVPDECDVIGYGDSLLADCCDPELTSIDIHVKDMCMAALSNLMQVFSKATPTHKIVIASEMRYRNSTTPDFSW